MPYYWDDPTSLWDGAAVTWYGADPLTCEIVADLDRDAFFCVDAAPGDALNIVPTPLTWASLDVSANGGSASKIDHETDYGIKAVDYTASSTTTAGVRIGHDGATMNDIPVVASTAYSASVWIKGIAAYDSIGLTVEVIDEDGVTLGSTTLTAAGYWQRATVGFTSGAASTFVYILVRKTNSASLTQLYISGVIVTEGSTAPAGFNVGHASNPYDNLTSHVEDAEWSQGQHKSWGEVAPPAALRLTLTNDDGDFSPNNPDAPYPAYLKRGVLVRVRVNLLDTDIQLWIGKVASQTLPLTRTQRRTVTLRAADQTEQLAQSEYMPDVNLDATVDAAILDVFNDPETVVSYPYDDNPDAVADYTNFDEGQGEFGFIGDALDKARDISGLNAITEYVAAEGGGMAWWEGRDEEWRFTNRHHDALASVVDTFYDTDIEWGDFTTGDEDIVNRVSLAYLPRRVETPGTVVWTASNLPIQIYAGQTRRVRGWYRHPTIESVGISVIDGIALAATTDYLGFRNNDGTGTNLTADLDVTADFRAGRIVVTITNNNADNHDIFITHLQARGTPLLTFESETVTAEDADSINTYGVQERRLSLPTVQTAEYAQALADHLIQRFAQPVPRFRSVRLMLDDQRDPARAYRILTRRISERIRVVSDQAYHDADYLIVGERHEVGDQQPYRVTWVLKPVPRITYWILGHPIYGVLGRTTRPIF